MCMVYTRQCVNVTAWPSYIVCYNTHTCKYTNICSTRTHTHAHAHTHTHTHTHTCTRTHTQNEYKCFSKTLNISLYHDYIRVLTTSSLTKLIKVVYNINSCHGYQITLMCPLHSMAFERAHPT